MTGPLSIACAFHCAPVGVACDDLGRACAQRITRALMVHAGIAPDERTAAIDPGKTPSPVLVEDAAARKVRS